MLVNKETGQKNLPGLQNFYSAKNSFSAIAHAAPVVAPQELRQFFSGVGHSAQNTS